MSRNIDEIITAYGQETNDIASSSKARAELAQLRAENERLRADVAMLPLGDVLNAVAAREWFKFAERLCAELGVAWYPNTDCEPLIIGAIKQLRDDLAQVTSERDAARAELESAKKYQRMAARR